MVPTGKLQRTPPLQPRLSFSSSTIPPPPPPVFRLKTPPAWPERFGLAVFLGAARGWLGPGCPSAPRLSWAARRGTSLGRRSRRSWGAPPKAVTAGREVWGCKGSSRAQVRRSAVTRTWPCGQPAWRNSPSCAVSSCCLRLCPEPLRTCPLLGSSLWSHLRSNSRACLFGFALL